MHFTIEGKNLTKTRDFHRDIVFGKNEHNLIYAHGIKGCSEWGQPGNLKIFEVNLLPSFFNKYLPEGKSFDLFREAIMIQKNSILSSNNYPITPSMMMIIYKIIHCDRKGVFKKMFLEAHVIELLMLQLEQISNCKQNPIAQLKKCDIDKLYAVKDIISNQLDKPCSLINLARQVGTNEYLLKKGFKELFGNTVFGYWQDIKMKEAKELLLNKGLTVAEVSEKIGYKNPQHFSTAFKRKFGYSPKNLKSI